MTLRDDDESIIAEVMHWTRRPTSQKRVAIVALTQSAHRDAVRGRFLDEGLQPERPNRLTTPYGDEVYLVVGDKASRGMRVDAAWVHPDCSDEVRWAVLPCVRSDDD